MERQTLIRSKEQGIYPDPKIVQDMLQLLFDKSLSNEAQNISIGVIGPSISISDDGLGILKEVFLQEFPFYKFKNLLDHLGCSKVQIISSTDEAAWSTGILTTEQLLQPRLEDFENPSTGTSYALQFDFILDDWERCVSLARGMLPIIVRLNGETIPTINLGDNTWISLEIAFPSGNFILNHDLEGGNLTTSEGFCTKVWDSPPRSLFIPSSNGEQSFQQHNAPRQLYVLALRAAARSLRSRLIEERWGGPTDKVGLDELTEWVRLTSLSVPVGQIPPRDLVDFGYLLGYAPIIKPVWKLTSESLELMDVSLERFDRRSRVVEGLGIQSCAILADSGIIVSPDSQSPPTLQRVKFNILSMVEGPEIYKSLERYSSNTHGPIVVPCREILLGEQKIQWAIVTPNDEGIIIDEDELGMVPWNFLAITWDKFQMVKTLLFEDSNLLKAFLWILSRQSSDYYDWCLFKTPASPISLSLDRARVILLEFMMKSVGVQDKTIENFCKRARQIEEMLNPSFVAGRLKIGVSDKGFAEKLNDLDDEVSRLKRIRRTLWSVTRDEV